MSLKLDLSRFIPKEASEPEPKPHPVTRYRGDWVVLDFGKYAGESLDEVPDSYIRWCLDNLDNLREEVRENMEERVRAYHVPDPERHVHFGRWG
jgi:hypothetical protein